MSPTGSAAQNGRWGSGPGFNPSTPVAGRVRAAIIARSQPCPYPCTASGFPTQVPYRNMVATSPVVSALPWKEPSDSWHPEILLSSLLVCEALCHWRGAWEGQWWLRGAVPSWAPLGTAPCMSSQPVVPRLVSLLSWPHLDASLGTVLDQEWKPLAFISYNVPPWHVSAPAGPTAPQRPSRTASTQTKERCWRGQHGSVSGMAEPRRHGADPGDPRTASLVTSYT